MNIYATQPRPRALVRALGPGALVWARGLDGVWVVVYFINELMLIDSYFQANIHQFTSAGPFFHAFAQFSFWCSLIISFYRFRRQQQQPHTDEHLTHTSEIDLLLASEQREIRVGESVQALRSSAASARTLDLGNALPAT